MEGSRYKIIPFEEWKETLDEIIELQEATVKELKERFLLAEKEHDATLIPYVKQFYFEKLVKEYTNLLDNKLMRKMGERYKDKYVFAINESGIPVIMNKKTYEMSLKYFGREGVREFYR